MIYFALYIYPFALECQVSRKRQPPRRNDGYLDQRNLLYLRLRLLLAITQLGPDLDYSFFPDFIAWCSRFTL